MATIQDIARSSGSLASPGMRRKDLIDAVRAQHPDASKKDIVRAAFYALIENADRNPDQARDLQAFALGERVDAEQEALLKAKVRKKRKGPPAAAR